MTYRVRFHPKAAEELSTLDTPAQPRIFAAIETLRTDPFKHGSIQLKGEKVRRTRVGDYRTIYEVGKVDATLTVFQVAHRREAYR